MNCPAQKSWVASMCGDYNNTLFQISPRFSPSDLALLWTNVQGHVLFFFPSSQPSTVGLKAEG